MIVRDSKKLLTYVRKGNDLKNQGKKIEAIASYGQALKVKKDYYELHNIIGVLYFDLGKIEEAILSYKNAIKIYPMYSIAYNNLGNALQAKGSIGQARISYEKAINIQSDFTLAYRNLSTIKKFKIHEPMIVKMNNLIKNKNLSKQDKINLNYALSKAYNDTQDFKNSFLHLKIANNEVHKKINYNIQNDKNFYKNIKALFSNNITSLSSEDNFLNINPIFILGMPRSGSTLLEQIISSHTEVYGAGELNHLDLIIRGIDWNNVRDFNVILKTINSKYLTSIKNFNTKENFITDKMPLNFRWIGFILLSIPHAKVIHTKRNAIATCWSIYKNYFVGDEHGFAYDQKNILGYYKLYLDLMNFWKKKFPNRIYDFVYEKVTEDIEYESKKVLEYIGLKWESQCLDFYKNNRFVKTNSANQVRQGIYKNSLKEWQNYKDNLSIFLKNLN